MTPEEIQLAEALVRCSHYPGTWSKRFARDIAAQAHTHPAKELTPNQRVWLYTLVAGRKKNIPAELVKLAQQRLTEMKSGPTSGTSGE